ncbi:MAG: bifunctional UDP-N-acetylglucosamine diphosphorylase/glucosamine-1-phosphate N-acetyltransferase GlmU [Helicobacteraceae bacterium]|jgi:bifunctional UDP-N-acetylglucosamine pyrophosphorylase/glucosamine-1-phosphate N-acetyltransferase|nr:bifunctional UDP-N-acetylglucosamine diphosphorylase/glucosamine-1-phosphate N-acetyltransferase GlmU [Helicobacteraceae bacterium]
MKDKFGSIVILAAGAGTRMKSAAPKVMHEISGRKMIDFVLNEALNASNDVILVLYHEFDAISKYINENFMNFITHNNLRITRQDHENFPGTGGAIKAAFSLARHDRIVVLNGDMPLITEEFINNLNSTENEMVLAILEMDDPSGYGRVITRGSLVQKIVEEKDAMASEKFVRSVNAGAYSFSKKFLADNLDKLDNNNAQKEYYITDLVEIAFKAGIEIAAVRGNKEILMGVNSKEDLAIAEFLQQKRKKQILTKSGVIMRLPDTIYIDDRAEFEGECILENGVVIIGKCKIKNSHIKAHSVIEESEIVESDIGPMAHIRPKCAIYETHIGNFVETKNATLKEVKAGHLSYLGDAEIGENTNIGAGTITCNYDGMAKHKTIIGKNVFIGSDTQLVAPVTIPDNVLIGAGTTLTKSPNSGDLVLTRSPQTSIANFFYKFFKNEPK